MNNKNILIISSILPVAELDHKKDENDILLVTEDNIRNVDPSIFFHYIYIIPFSSYFLSFFSKKWKQYYLLRKKKALRVEHRVFHILPVIQFPKRTFLDSFFWSISLIFYKRKIRTILDAENIDLVHCHNSVLNGFIGRFIYKSFKIPYIITDRGVKNYRKLSKIVYSNWEMSSCVISLNILSQDSIPTEFKLKNILIPHGLDSSIFIKQESKIDNNYCNNSKIRLVSVGRLLKSKNFETLIKAMVNLENFELDIYGRGPEEGNLNQLVVDLKLADRVSFRGFLPNDKLIQRLSSYDVFVLLSFKESFGRVYLEAMARGLMIVCSKGTGFDGIIQNGEEGFIIEANNLSEYIKALKSLEINRNLIFEMSGKAYCKATHYKWELIARELINVYDKNISDVKNIN